VRREDATTEGVQLAATIATSAMSPSYELDDRES
jgi:hypothetical protein